jgi:hypothetical protein
MRSSFFLTPHSSPLAPRFLILLGMMAFSCTNYPTDTSGRDLYEMESVWQYLKAYSIWQDRIPVNPFDYSSPGSMMSGLYDTLHGYSYTHYYNGPAFSAKVAYSQSINDVTPMVVFDSITGSTAYIQFYYEFVRSTYNDFLAILPLCARFKNIIVDVRGNGGGDLMATDSIIECFVKAGRPYLVTTYRQYNSATRTAATIENDTEITQLAQNIYLRNKRIVVLANRRSASASEIVVAALKEASDTCYIAGDTTYGKGIGQIILSRAYIGRPDVQITSMRFHGVSSRIGYYHQKGIYPDYLLETATDTASWFAQIDSSVQLVEPGAIITRRHGIPDWEIFKNYMPKERIAYKIASREEMPAW